MRARILRAPAPARLGRVRRWWLIPLLLALAAGIWLWTGRDQTSEADRVRLAPPTGPRTIQQDLCMVELIDQSSSMSSSDPQRLRATAVGAVGDWLGRYGRRGDRLGVVWFADRASAFPPVAPRDRAAALARAAQDPGESLGGSTNMVDGLEASGRLLGGCPSGSRRVLVVVSDGVVDDPDEVERLIRALPAGTRVHLLAMDMDEGYSSSASGLWEDPALGLASIQRIRRIDAAGITDPVAFVLGQETGQRVRQAD